MPYDFSISQSVLPNGRTAYYAKLNNSDQARFLVGYKTLYDGNKFGLYNTLVVNQGSYNPASFAQQHDFWAYFIAPTARAESNNSYSCLNTYDRAKFTFGFMQYAVHVPEGDFVRFLRKLLTLPNANLYFPRLILVNNRIHYQNGNTITQLESNSSTQGLMDYCNPSLDEVENQELICSARMIHWAINDPKHKAVQVELAIQFFQENMKSYHQRFGLDGAPAKVCAMVCDIRHQGRGTNDRIANALNTGGDYEKAFRNLCSIGASNYQGRINTVRNTISSLLTSGQFNQTYQAANNVFV